MDRKINKGGILIIAEHDGERLHRITFELLGIARILSNKKEMDISCLCLVPEGVDLEEAAKRGADEVYRIRSNAFSIQEELLYKTNIIQFIKEKEPEIVLFGATNFGRSLAPRVAAGLKTGLTADCTGFDINEEGRLVQIRPAFSDNIFAHIHTATDPQMATVRYKEFPEADYQEERTLDIIDIEPYCTSVGDLVSIIEMDAGHQDISEADIVVSAGRGIKRSEDLQMIQELADLLGGRMGASRALVDAGIADSSIQVGYSGHRVKPKLYVAIGISGAPQHLAGMKESGMIIAINSDPSAPIFRIADVGCVGDLYEVVPELINSIKNRRAL